MTDGGWADYKRSLSGFSGFDSGIQTLKDKAKTDKTKLFEIEKLGIGDAARKIGETKATLDTIGESSGGLATTMLSVRSFGGMKKLLGQVRDKIGALEPKSGEKNSVAEGDETKADSAEQPAEAEDTRTDMEKAFGTEEEQNEMPDWMKPAFEKNNAEDIPEVPTVDNAPKTVADIPEDTSIIRGPRELAEPDVLEGRFFGRHDFLDKSLGKGINYLKQRGDFSGGLLKKPQPKGPPAEPEEDTTKYTNLDELPDAEFTDIAPKATNPVTQAFENIGKTATQPIESVGQDLKTTIADTTQDLASKAGDTLKGLGGKLLGGADEAAEDATEAATAAAEEGADAAIGAGAQAFDAIPVVGEIIGALAGIGTAIAGGIEAGEEAKDEEKENEVSKQELQINAASMLKNQYGNSVTPTLTSMTQMPSNSGIF